MDITGVFGHLVTIHEISDKRKNNKFFNDLISILRENEKIGPLINTQKCAQLDAMRNNFKHNFVIPEARQVEEIVLWVKVQMDQLINAVFGKSLEDFSLLEMVKSEDVKKLIEESDVALEAGDLGLCSERLATAYKVLDKQKREAVCIAMGVSIPPIDSPDFYDSAELKMEQGHLAKAWDQMISSVKFQNLTLSADLLNVDRSDFLALYSNRADGRD